MQTSTVKATLAKLLSLGRRVSEIRAVLRANVVSGISESKSTDQSEYALLYSISKEHRMAKLEAEVQRACARGHRIFRI